MKPIDVFGCTEDNIQSGGVDHQSQPKVVIRVSGLQIWKLDSTPLDF